MKSKQFFFAVGMWVIAAFSAQAFVSSPDHSLPNWDARERMQPGAVAVDRAGGIQRLQKQLPLAVVDFDPVTGAPQSVSAGGFFLTGQGGVGRGVSSKFAARFQAADPHRAVKAFLEEHRDLFGHGAEVLADARVSRDYVTAHNGLRTVVWEQQVDGIRVFDGILSANTTRNGELAALSSRFIPKPAAAAFRGTPKASALQASPTVSAFEALSLAVEDIGDSLISDDSVELGSENDAEQTRRFSAKPLKGDAQVRLAWLPMSAQSLRLCWQTTFFSRARAEMFLTLVDVDTGEILLRRSLTAHLSAASYRVYTHESPMPMLPGLLTPSTAQASLVDRELVTISALDTNASPNGWINDGDNQTKGNNVDAHLDINADNLPDLPRPQGSPDRVFDFPLDLTLAPASYSSASVVELFYWCNWYHDKLYELGFTEAAGNFQTDNFGRGGNGGDAVLADAQDGSGTDNANFSAPSDGSPGRMQMYVFTGPTPDRDGSLDTTIVLHEYTHGLSTRLVGGGQGLNTTQAGGMGEGWSDFYAMSHLCDPSLSLSDPYPMAAYCSYALSGLYRNYYFGMRRYPYCTDMTINPLTFKDIDPSQAIAHTGIPLSPISPFVAADADEVHNAGEVWCSMLWEVRALLIQKYGGEAGNKLVLQIVTDGLKLTPANPNFIQARDAILAADLIDTGGANYKEIWSAFAKRGLGFSATSPASWLTLGLSESYDSADDLLATPSNVTFSGPAGGPFTTSYQNWQLRNLGTNRLAWSAGSSAAWMALSLTSGSLSPMESETNFAVYLTAPAYALSAGSYTNTILLTNLISGRVQTRRFVLVVGQSDYFAEIISDSSFLLNTSYTFTPDNTSSAYNVCQEAITDLPTDPSGGTLMDSGDDTYLHVTLSSTNNVLFYKRGYNNFYIGSNGYITFGSSDAHNTVSYSIHFAYPRIAGFLTDLDTTTNGVISWSELDDRVAVTWLNVPQYGEINQNTFQIEMFFDGRIRLNYLQMDSQDAVIGLSKGSGTPSNFAPSDFSGYPLCGTVKQGLRLFAPATVARGVGNLPLTVQIAEPLDTDVTVIFSSSNTGLVAPPATVTIPAGQTNVVVNATVAADDALLQGPQVVTLTAAAANTISGVTLVSVTDSRTPALTLTLPSSAMAGTSVAGAVTLETAAQYDLVVLLNSENTALAQVPAAIIVPAGQTHFEFQVVVPTNALSSSALVSLNVSASYWQSDAASMLIRKTLAKPGLTDLIFWETFASTQQVNQPFQAGFKVIDNLNQWVTNSISVTFSVLLPSIYGTMLDSVAPSSTSSFGTYTLGYQFTPTTNMLVTHVRSYGGLKISIWSTNQTLLASAGWKDITPRWTNTPLSTPLQLTAGTPYVLGVYTGGATYAWSSAALPKTFAFGTIDQGYYSSVDEFPTRLSTRLYLVDLIYTVNPSDPITVTPQTFSGLVNGVWSGEFALDGAVDGVRLVVDDGQGHSATSDPFNVVPGAPRLTATLSSGAIRLAWPASAANYVLESTASLGAAWSAVADSPVLNGSNYSVTNSAVGAQFYRLRK